LALTLRWAVAGAVMGVVLGVVRRLSPLLFVWRTLLFGASGLVIGVMLYGNGALPTSLAVVCIAAPTCTFLGLVFALLGQRSRLAGVRRSLDVLSILPIITPPFILAFSMIFLLGRRGLITYNVFDLSTKDRKSTRLNSSHVKNSYAVFCLKKKREKIHVLA